MTDIVRRSHEIQNRLLKRVAGSEWVVYTGGGITARVKMVRGQTRPSKLISEGELHVGRKYCDWLIPTDEFVTDAGELITPIVGATITTELDGEVYEVVDGPNGRPFDSSDSRRVRMRIHTDYLPE